MNNIEYIYGLYPDDDMSNIIYCGRAQCPYERLKKHLSECKRGTSKKNTGLRELIQAGHTINVVVLEKIDLSNCYGDEEDTWINNLTGAGAKLLNGTGGSTGRYQYIPTDDEPWKPWTPDDFKDVKWERAVIGSKTSEWGCHIRGIAFYRSGWSKLRMNHPRDGGRTCHGFVWDKKIELLCDYMNELHAMALKSKG